MAIEVAGVVARLGFRVDDDGANRFERKMRDLRSDAKRDVVVPLKGDLQPRDLDLYDKKLSEIRAKVRRREDFKAQLGADYDARAFNAYERDSRRVQRTTDDSVKSAGRLRTAFGNVWVGGVGAFAAAGGGYAIFKGLQSIVAASGEAEVSAGKLKTQVEALGRDYDKHAEKIDRVIQKTSLLAGIDDEDLADAFTNIARTSGSVQEGLEGIGIAADIARARHMDVAKAGDLVGKVFAGNFTALKRYGIVLDDNATKEEAIAAIQQKFAGQAETYGKTQTGAIERMQVAWENLQETIGEKLGPQITRTANRIAKFVTGMAEGTGKGGEFADKLKEIWGRLVSVYEALRDANTWIENFYASVGRGAKRTADDLLGLISTIIGGFAATAEAGAKIKIPGMKGVAKDLRDMQHDLDKTREGLRKTADEANKVDMSKVRKENRQTGKAFADMAKDGGASMRDIARTARRRSDDIRQDLGGNSEEGKRALTKNFRQAMDAVHRQMDRGGKVTKAGMREIRGYLADELRVYGLDIAEGQKLVGKHPLAGSDKLGSTPNQLGPNHPFAGKAGGGWIGAPGQVGQDSVPAMLAPGEAVLNRHQQAVIEGMLGGGFLDSLFARVQTPHYMAKGGIVPVPGFPGESAASSVIPKILQIARQFGLTLTDAFGAGHKSPGHTRFGTAADFAGPDASMDAAVASLVRSGYTVGYDGRFGSAAWPGHGPSSVAGSNAHLHVELGGKGGAIAGALAKIAGVGVKGGGQVGRVVQAALNVARAGAQTFYEGSVNSSLAVPVGGGGTGGGNAGNRALGRRMLGNDAQFASLDPLWTGESGWNHLASNPSSGAYGIPQSLPGSKMASAGADWRTNPATQIKWGLGYIRDRYGSPAKAYQAWLGRSPHWYASGGRAGAAGKAPPIDDKTMAWMQSLWGRFAPMLGQSPSTKVRDLFKYTEGKGLFVGVDGINPSKGEFGLMWPKWLGKPNKSLTQLFVHEMAHRFQKTGQTGSYRLAEGGAEAFARRVMASQFGGPARSTTYAGLADWVTKHKGEGWINYRQFGRQARARGGVVGRAVQYFNGGGRPQVSGSHPQKTTPGKWDRGFNPYLLGRSAFNRPKLVIAGYEAISNDIERLGHDYEVADRRYGQSEEVLLNDDGTINAEGIAQRVAELDGLIALRDRILQRIKDAAAMARRIVESYQAVLKRLTRSLRHAHGKERTGVKAQIATAYEEIDTWRGVVTDRDREVQFAELDLSDLQNERAEVAGTVARPDSASTDTGGDTGDTAAPTPEQIAQGVAEQMSAFQSARKELFSNFGSNFTLAGGALVPNTITGNAAGLSHFGALTSGEGGGFGGAGGVTKIVNQTNVFPTPPPEPHHFARLTLYDLEAAP